GDYLGRLLGFQGARVRAGGLSAGPVEPPHLGIRPDEFVPVIVEAAPGVIDVPPEPEFRIEPVPAAPEEHGLLIDLGLVQGGIDGEPETAPEFPRLGAIVDLNANGIDREVPASSAGAGADPEAIPTVSLDHLLEHLLHLGASQTLAIGPGRNDF